MSESAFDDLDAAFEQLWQRLGRGVADRRSPWHTPAVATLGNDGAPEARVMVLRGVDRERAVLRVHTDRRAGKVAGLARDPRASLLFYDSGAKLQLRARGIARLLLHGSAADAAWAATSRFARRCYLAPEPPGSVSPVPRSGLPAAVEQREPSQEESEAGRTAFAVVEVEIASLEWLYLAHAGHRRAVHRREETGWQAQWLTP